MNIENKEGAGVPVAWKVETSAGALVGFYDTPRDHSAAQYYGQTITPLFANPPAVRPAAPSDAVLDDVIQIVRNIYGGVRREEFGLPEAFDAMRARAHASIRASISQSTPFPDPPHGYCSGCGGSGEQTFLSGGRPDAYDEVGNCQRCDGTGAEPAAGEQAGAVNVQSLQAMANRWEDQAVEETATRRVDGHCIAAALRGCAMSLRNALAAPGAAIAAREQPTDEQILALIDKQPVRQHHGAAVFEYRLFGLIDFARKVLAIASREEAPAIRRRATPSDYVNGAGIRGDDDPVEVVRKLDAEFRRRAGER